MRSRLLAPLVVVFLVLAGAATAAATTGVFEANDSGLDSPRDVVENSTAVSTPSTSLPETTLPPTTLPDDNAGDAGDNRTEDQTFVNLPAGATQTFAAGDAGSVTIRSDGTTLTVLAANANAGFTREVEQGTGTEIEVQFGNGAARVDFNAELEDGTVRVRVRARGVVEDVPVTTMPSTTLPPTTTPEDNRGPDNAHEGEDNSGPGNAHDSADDDHSGPAHSGSDDSGSDDSGSDNSGSGHSGSGH